MKRRIPNPKATGLAVGLALGLVSGCGGGGDTMTPTPALNSTVVMLDSAAVLAMARQTSEVSSPVPVDEGTLELTDTSDTADPISINVM